MKRRDRTPRSAAVEPEILFVEDWVGRDERFSDDWLEDDATFRLIAERRARLRWAAAQHEAGGPYPLPDVTWRWRSDPSELRDLVLGAMQRSGA